MKLLIATGRLAENTVRKAALEKADVLVADIDIAAFITPKKLIKAFQEANFSKNYDLILLPGLVKGDFLKASEKLGCKIRLGPKHAYDLGFVLQFSENIEFSEKIPACELLIDIRKEMALELIRSAENEAHSPLTLREVKIGGKACMKVMGEIVGAMEVDARTLQVKIKAFIARGADIIDLGATLDTLPEQVRRTVSLAKTFTTVPISIDTLDPELINEGVEAGADLVLSLNSKNMGIVGPTVARTGTAAVIIPDEGNSLESLVRNIEAARRLGIEKIIADPILDPVGHNIAESIVRYYDFHRLYPQTPVFLGVGNVTELMDVDTIGVNAILCGIGAEAGASILFTPEFSDKAQGSIRELKRASQMMQLSTIRESSPKDLGLDLLCIKEKRRRPDFPLPENAIQARSSKNWLIDPAGPIRIRIVPDSISGNGGMIVAEHKKASVVGKNAREVMDTLLELEILSRLDHAAYLGRELEKAELALQFNRSYAQDDVF
jgi:dihydropteroate synthase-like protein